MSRVKKGVASGGKGATSQEGSRADSKLELMMEKYMVKLEEKFYEITVRFAEIDRRYEERFTRLEKPRSAGQAGVQERVLEETSTQRHGVSKVGVIQDTPQTGTRMLQGKGQPSSGHHEEDQDQVPASRPGYRDEKGSEPGGESIRGGIVKRYSTLESFQETNLRNIPSASRSSS